MSRSRGLAWALVLVVFASSGGARGQSLPAAVDSGRIEKRFDTAPAPRSTPEPLLPEPESAPPPEQAAGIRFRLDAITVDGATVFDEAALTPLWADKLGTEVSLAEVFELRDAVTAKYRDAGYVLSQAVIPAQRVRGGAVRLQVVEGFITEVSIQGDVTDRLGLLRVMGEKIKASRPLDIADMERYVMLADDLPGVALRTVLEAADGVPGGSVLTLVVEPEPESWSLTADNRGTHTVGPAQFTAAGTATGHLELFDRLSMQGIVTNQIGELRYFDLSHLIPIDSEGTTLTLGARRSWSRPGYNIRALEIDSVTRTLRAVVSHPFLRSRSETLRGDFTFTHRDSATKVLRSPQSEDRLRIVSAELSYDASDSLGGSNLLELGAHRGLDVLNATKTGSADLTRARGHSDFTKFTALAQRTQSLGDEMSLVVAGEAQFSPVELLSSEEFGVGGKYYGRAFDSSEITGDSGAEVKLELSHTLPAWPAGTTDYAQAYVFGDLGAVWDRSDGVVKRAELASYGVGLRLGLLGRMDAAIELTRPMIRTPDATGDRDMRAFFTVTARY